MHELYYSIILRLKKCSCTIINLKSIKPSRFPWGRLKTFISIGGILCEYVRYAEKIIFLSFLYF